MPTKKVIESREARGVCVNCGSPSRSVVAIKQCQICLDKYSLRTKKYREDNPDIIPTISVRHLSNRLKQYEKAKEDHVNSPHCERGAIGGCTACHFWSGSIAAILELMGQ